MSYPCDIPGVQPFGAAPRASGHLVLSERADRTTIERLVLDLPANCRFTFFDRNFPSPSDPGAYVSYEKSGPDYRVTRGNHGWSEPASVFTASELIDYFLACRQFNLGFTPDEVMWMFVPPERNVARDRTRG